MSNTYEKKPWPTSGFYPLASQWGCTYPSHNPPSHMVIPPGMYYKHICPGCGVVQNLFSDQIFCQDKGTTC